MPLLLAGSKARAGFVVAAANPDAGFYPDYPTIFGDLEGCLYDTGQFEYVELFLNADGTANTFFKDYIRVQGITAADFGNTEDFGGLIAQMIQYCAPSIKVVQRDPVVVDSVPQQALGQQGIQQVNATDAGPTRMAQGPAKCDNLGFIDYLGCQTGISSTGTKTTLVIGGIGLLIILALTLRR